MFANTFEKMLSIFCTIVALGTNVYVIIAFLRPNVFEIDMFKQIPRFIYFYSLELFDKSL